MKKTCSCDVWYGGDRCDESVLSIYEGYYVGTVRSDSNERGVGFNLSVGTSPEVMLVDSLEIQLIFTDEARFEVPSQETEFDEREGEGEMLIDLISIRLEGASGSSKDQLTIEARNRSL